VKVPIVGSEAQTTHPLTIKRLTIRVRENESSRIVEINFLIVEIPMAYNVILKCPTLNAIEAVVAPYLVLIQFEVMTERWENCMIIKRWLKNAIM